MVCRFVPSLGTVGLQLARIFHSTDRFRGWHACRRSVLAAWIWDLGRSRAPGTRLGRSRFPTTLTGLVRRLRVRTQYARSTYSVCARVYEVAHTRKPRRKLQHFHLGNHPMAENKVVDAHFVLESLAEDKEEHFGPIEVCLLTIVMRELTNPRS